MILQKLETGGGGSRIWRLGVNHAYRSILSTRSKPGSKATDSDAAVHNTPANRSFGHQGTDAVDSQEREPRYKRHLLEFPWSPSSYTLNTE